MKKAVIFGGSGFIGTFLAQHLLKNAEVEQVVLFDLKPSSLTNHPKIKYVQGDVRKPIDPAIVAGSAPDWIFNFAAVHREPGHEAYEYFETNIAGAENVCKFAEQVQCKNIYFTSSISVYGPTKGATSEESPICPISPYGGSKYPAELIHKTWLKGSPDHRLIIVRPGVVYGPNDPGNIGRMISAIRKGYFAFPGSMNIYKSYAYVFGLIDSIDFVIAANERLITYNYVEYPTETLGTIANDVKRFLNSKAPIVSLPLFLLLPAAHLVQLFLGKKNPIHPVRVKKVGMSTYIIPQKLIDMGFKFNYTFKSSLEHWKKFRAEDFN